MREPNVASKHLELPVFNSLKLIFKDAFPAAVQKHTNSAKENIKLIETALKNNDGAELELAAHSLKGASGQFGANQLSELARQMEMFGKDAELDKAKEVFPKLKKEREQAEKEMMNEIEQA